MDRLNERAAAIIVKITALKEKSKATDVLTTELNKNKDKLPSSVRTALTAYEKKKK